MALMLREAYLGTLVFMGAGVGGALRYAVSRLVPAAGGLPWPTFLVNALGCFVMGLLAAWLAARPEASGHAARLLLGTGVLGGFTTFSAFSIEVAWIWERGATGLAAAYVLASVAAALAGVFGGLALGRALL